MASTKQRMRCPKCAGEGRITHYAHVDEGVCYECKGQKYILVTPSRASRIAEREAKLPAFRFEVGDRVRIVRERAMRMERHGPKMFTQGAPGTIKKAFRNGAGNPFYDVAFDHGEGRVTKNVSQSDIERATYFPRHENVPELRRRYAAAQAKASRWVDSATFRREAKKWAEWITGVTDPGPLEWAEGAEAAADCIQGERGGRRDPDSAFRRRLLAVYRARWQKRKQAARKSVRRYR